MPSRIKNMFVSVLAGYSPTVGLPKPKTWKGSCEVGLVELISKPHL